MRLFEDLCNALAPLQLIPRGLVQVGGAELGKGDQLSILGQVQADAPCDTAHGPTLGGSADARDRESGVYGGSYACVKEVRLQVYLSVCDGDDVGGDVG